LQKIVIQPELCDGCRDCEEACKKLYGASRIMIRELDDVYYPIICQQCEDAPCRTVCPTDAIDDEVDPERCIGCGLCMVVCPFGAVVMEDRKAQKCSQCPDLDTPACVKACSKRALSIIDTERLKLERQKKFVSRMAGVSKGRKGSDILSILTAKGKARQKLEQED
jgi:carbon-monoxide dehydrogenase iron sulfur subunit